ncbi:MAG: 23S rRNA (pseudouridine(1915)-N(3))-methyltransferase RlmH [Candidatus Muiribacteriota bacterium]
MKVELICAGKLKKEFELLCDFYEKRCRQFINLKIIEIKGKKEKELDYNIIKNLKSDYFKILFSPDGFEMKKDNCFFKIFSKHARVQFIIGGDNGVGEIIKKEADKIFSISNLVFPHQLFRILILEQIYRGMAIFNNHPYHKG